jgi:hypothetical protein
METHLCAQNCTPIPFELQGTATNPRSAEHAGTKGISMFDELILRSHTEFCATMPLVEGTVGSCSVIVVKAEKISDEYDVCRNVQLRRNCPNTEQSSKQLEHIPRVYSSNRSQRFRIISLLLPFVAFFTPISHCLTYHTWNSVNNSEWQ